MGNVLLLKTIVPFYSYTRYRVVRTERWWQCEFCGLNVRVSLDTVETRRSGPTRLYYCFVVVVRFQADTMLVRVMLLPYQSRVLPVSRVDSVL